jgi:hypothetical protein
MRYIGTFANGVFYREAECDFYVFGTIVDPSATQYVMLEYPVVRGTIEQCKSYAKWRNTELSSATALKVACTSPAGTPGWQLARIRTTPVLGHLFKQHSELQDAFLRDTVGS